MAPLLLLVSCKTPSEYPDVKLYSVDLLNEVCVEFSLVDKVRGIYDVTAELPIERCDQVIGYMPEGYGAMRIFVKDLKETVDRGCE